VPRKVKPIPILDVTATTHIVAARHSKYGYALRDLVTRRHWFIVYRGFRFVRNVLL